jgi:protease I
MEQSLQGKRVAVLMTDGVEQVAYTQPRAFLEERGARVVLVAPKAAGTLVQGVDGHGHGTVFAVEVAAADAAPGDYDGLLLPGGTASAASLRLGAQALAFIKALGEANKPIAAICHGPLALIDAGLARARHLTSTPSLQAALREAGAEWTDDAVVVHDRLVTSRGLDDLAAFNDAFMKELIVAGLMDTGPGA